jgi:hypothetical protein
MGCDSEMLRKSDAAKRFGVSIDTLDRWAKDGLIGKSKVGHCVWFAADDIRDVIAAPLRARTVVPMQAHPAPDQDWRTDPFWTGDTAAPMPKNGARRKARASH